MISQNAPGFSSLSHVNLNQFDSNNSSNLDGQEFNHLIESLGYSQDEASLLSQFIMNYDGDKLLNQSDLQGISLTPEKLAQAAAMFKVESFTGDGFTGEGFQADDFLMSDMNNAEAVVAESKPADRITPDTFPDSPTKIQFANNKPYDITLVPQSNFGQPALGDPIHIPANTSTEVDIAALAQSDSWSGNFEIRAADTNEPTGALLELNLNAAWADGSTRHFFNVSYINGIPHNAAAEDFINTVARMPNGLTQGNENGDLNDFLGDAWDQLYQDGMMRPLQNGTPLHNNTDNSGLNLMAEKLLAYREQTDSGFYLYTGTASANFADDQFSQSWSGNQGMNIEFY